MNKGYLYEQMTQLFARSYRAISRVLYLLTA